MPITRTPPHSSRSASTSRRIARLGAAAALAAALTAPLSLATTAPAASADPFTAPPVVSLWHDLPELHASARVSGLAHDAAGDLWYSDSALDVLVRVDADTHVQTSYDIAAKSNVLGMVGTPDGALWFTDSTSHTISRLDPATGAIVPHTLSGLSSLPWTVMLGADGGIWLGDPFVGNLVRIDPGTGVLSAVADPTGMPIIDLVAAPDGRLWYVRQGGGNNVVAFDPSTKAFTEVATVDDGYGIAAGKGGSVWVSGPSRFTEIAIDGSSVIPHPVDLPSPVPSFPHAVLGGDLVGDDDNELYFLDSYYGLGTVDSHGTTHFSRLDGTRTALAFDGLGHLWVNDTWGTSLNWM
ncbi:hypothetical protein N1031_12105 [Herbiconiux moechotypicola]|uniref:SMP-30/Gluconolactonase/LRE-like region domain-containing protein n=1 Tax=Herbiconiux moechotypicola TaxID=637393 RepID=A0ABP5QP97_9MICO|nr:hypothetical protein [Herbiconiux moechotypicola]MCS5730506.1 hypothetical protein [Herbiconiux moechotypicola]